MCFLSFSDVHADQIALLGWPTLGKSSWQHGLILRTRVVSTGTPGAGS